MSNNECKYIELAGYTKCKDLSHLETVFQDILDKGGEGVILRDPNAPLQSGRSAGFLKHKVTYSYTPTLSVIIHMFILAQKFRDAEARVVRKLNSGIWECELYSLPLVKNPKQHTLTNCIQTQQPSVSMSGFRGVYEKMDSPDRGYSQLSVQRIFSLRLTQAAHHLSNSKRPQLV